MNWPATRHLKKPNIFGKSSVIKVKTNCFHCNYPAVVPHSINVEEHTCFLCKEKFNVMILEGGFGLPLPIAWEAEANQAGMSYEEYSIYQKRRFKQRLVA